MSLVCLLLFSRLGCEAMQRSGYIGIEYFTWLIMLELSSESRSIRDPICYLLSAHIPIFHILVTLRHTLQSLRQQLYRDWSKLPRGNKFGGKLRGPCGELLLLRSRSVLFRESIRLEKACINSRDEQHEEDILPCPACQPQMTS
jgi:hypothetical protein